MIPYRFHLILMFSFSSILCVKHNGGNGKEGNDFSTFFKDLCKFRPSLSCNLRAIDKGKSIFLDNPSTF